MNESILITIKLLIGIPEEELNFDTQLITHINSVFASLTQLGSGPKEGFRIKNQHDLWSSYFGDREDIDFIITYVHLKVWLRFDPPDNSTVIKAIQEDIKELEWRLNIAVDTQGV